MSVYTGDVCPVCHNAFKDGEDVVVCPECGTPHHRSCYMEKGGCANLSRHAEGYVWKSEKPEPPKAEKVDTENSSMINEIPVMNVDVNSADGSVRVNRIDYFEEIEPGVSVGEVCDYVGKNSVPFLMKFKALKKGRRVVVNWSAFFFNFLYCFYRKMYKLGAILVVITLLLTLPNLYLATEVAKSAFEMGEALDIMAVLEANPQLVSQVAFWSNFTNIANTIVCIFTGMFFNKMYYKKVITDIRKIKRKAPYQNGSQQLRYAINYAGGVNFTAIPLAIAGVMVLYFGVAFLATFLILH